MFEQLLEKLAIAFESNNVPYMIIGGQAVLVYGEPRFSKDIDVTLGWDSVRVSDLLKLVQGLGWKVLVDKPEEFAKQTMVLPCQDPISGIRFDFIFSYSTYEHQALSRAIARPIGSAQVRYASPEDLVILKIIAGRPRDIEDVRGILLKNATLDKKYIRQWLLSFEKALDRSLMPILDELVK